jgi:outer membrane protein OmpA-like peptidoglycan-associated protein/tetratricopeptide (TPR) repeat protein
VLAHQSYVYLVLNHKKMHLKYILSLVVFMSTNAFVLVGQSDYTTAINASKKTKEAYKKAYTYIMQRDYKSAKKDLNKLMKKDPTFVNSYIQMGYISEVEGNFENAKGFFKKALELAPNYYPKSYMDLSRIGMKEEAYEDVVTHLTKFLTHDKIHPNLVKLAKKRLGNAKFRPKALANPVPFEPKNLGENINSEHREYFPSITLEDELVYTVQIGKGQQGQEDLYRSQCNEDEWEKRQPIADVNTSENEAAQSISADGKLLVFTVCNRREDYGSCDLYYSKKINGKWTKPKNIGMPINSKNWESQPTIAPNGDAIYFVRGGARGQGNKNLYVSRLQVDGTWGTPENVSELNTPYNESSPSLHPDGKTLYFSSDGHPGMGGLDLFVTRMQEDGSWGVPVNLGYPINTEKQEEALAVNRKGTLAYLASDRLGGYGSMDLYSFELPEEARPSTITYINGITLSAETSLPLTAEVEIVDLKTEKVVLKLQTPKNGTFIACLPVGQYALNAKKDGYLFFSANYDLTEEKSLDLAYPLEARLQPIVYKDDDPTKKTVREPIVLENVFFATASAKLKPESKIELDKLKAFLIKNESLRIQLNGHTDNVGKPEDNLTLSGARAKAVMEYLIKEGIDKERLKAKGFGETKPKYSNESVSGRAGNRRTAFEVL